MLIETCTSDNGKMTKLMELVNTYILMELNMKESGILTSNKEEEEKAGLMEPCLREIISMARSMAMGISSGLMAAITEVNSKTTTSTVLETTDGLMAVPTKESGNSTRCTESVSLPGMMEESIMEITMMTRSKVKEPSPGLMAEYTQVGGQTASSMESENTFQVQERLNTENGKKERESNGLNLKRFQVISNDYFAFK